VVHNEILPTLTHTLSMKGLNDLSSQVLQVVAKITKGIFGFWYQTTGRV